MYWRRTRRGHWQMWCKTRSKGLRYSVIPVPREAVGTDLGGEPYLSGAALDHLERTQARHCPNLERIATPRARSSGRAAVRGDHRRCGRPRGRRRRRPARCGGQGRRCTVPPSRGGGRTSAGLGCSSRRREARPRRSPARNCRRLRCRTVRFDRGHALLQGHLASAGS